MIIQIHKLHHLQGHKAAIYNLSKGAEMGSFYSVGGDGWIVKWTLSEGNLGQLLAKTDTKIFTSCVFPDQQLLAAGNMEGGIHWIDIQQKKEISAQLNHQRGVFAITPLDQNHALTGGGLGKLIKWDLNTLQKTETLELSAQSIRDIHIHQEYIIVGASDHKIYLLDKNLGLVDIIENAHQNSVFTIASSKQTKQQFITGSRDAQFKVWDFQKNNIHQQNAHWFTINDIKYSPNGAIFATASRDKTIRIWRSIDYQLIKEINSTKNAGHINSVNCLLWLDDETLVSCSDDRTIIIWKIETLI